MADEKIRNVLFSIIEKRARDKSLNVPMESDNVEMLTEAEYERRFNEIDILMNAIGVISQIAEKDSELVRPIIPTIISLLDYEYFPLLRDVTQCMIYLPNKDNIEAFGPAVPKLVKLLEYKAYNYNDAVIDNRASVENALCALNVISDYNCNLIRSAIPTLIEYLDSDSSLYKETCRRALLNYAEKNVSFMKVVLSKIIPYLDELDNAFRVENVAKSNFEIIAPSIPLLIQQFDKKTLPRESIYLLSLIAKKDSLSLLPYLEVFSKYDGDDKWIQLHVKHIINAISESPQPLAGDDVSGEPDRQMDENELINALLSVDKSSLSICYLDSVGDMVEKDPTNVKAWIVLGETIYDYGDGDTASGSNKNGYHGSCREKGVGYLEKAAKIEPGYEILSRIGSKYELTWMLLGGFENTQTGNELLRNS